MEKLPLEFLQQVAFCNAAFAGLATAGHCPAFRHRHRDHKGTHIPPHLLKKAPLLKSMFVQNPKFLNTKIELTNTNLIQSRKDVPRGPAPVVFVVLKAP